MTSKPASLPSALEHSKSTQHRTAQHNASRQFQQGPNRFLAPPAAPCAPSHPPEPQRAQAGVLRQRLCQRARPLIVNHVAVQLQHLQSGVGLQADIPM